MAPATLDRVIAARITQISNAISAVHDSPERDVIYAMSSGNIDKPILVPAGTPLGRLLDLLKPLLAQPGKIARKINKNPCEACKKNHQRCMIVSGVGEAILCKKCQERGLLHCALSAKVTPTIQQQGFTPAPLHPQPGPSFNGGPAHWKQPQLIFHNQGTFAQGMSSMTYPNPSGAHAFGHQQYEGPQL